MKELLLLFSLIYISFSNLVWGGDFEYYSGQYQHFQTNYIATIPSQRSNWYDINMGQIQRFEGNSDNSMYRPFKLCSLYFMSRYSTNCWDQISTKLLLILYLCIQATHSDSLYQ